MRGIFRFYPPKITPEKMQDQGVILGVIFSYLFFYKKTPKLFELCRVNCGPKQSYESDQRFFRHVRFALKEASSVHLFLIALK